MSTEHAEAEHADFRFHALTADFAPYLDAVGARVQVVEQAYFLALPTGDTLALGHDASSARRNLAALADKHAQRERDRKPMGRPPSADRAAGVVRVHCELAADLHAAFTAHAASRSLTLRAAVEEALRLWVSTDLPPP